MRLYIDYGKDLVYIEDQVEENKKIIYGAIVNINLEVGEKISLLEASEKIRKSLNTSDNLFKFSNHETFINDKSFDYYIIGETYITIHFEVIGNTEKGIETEIKITKIELT